MLYELIAVVRPGRVGETKDIARIAGSLILSQRGVIRSIDNWGTYLLTSPVKKHRAWHSEGHHFVMRFDCSPDTQAAVRKMLGLDPRMLRFGITRMGDKNGTLASIADIRGASWSRLASKVGSGGEGGGLEGLVPNIGGRGGRGGFGGDGAVRGVGGGVGSWNV